MSMPMQRFTVIIWLEDWSVKFMRCMMNALLCRLPGLRLHLQIHRVIMMNPLLKTLIALGMLKGIWSVELPPK